MKKNIFDLTTEQLKEIVQSFQQKFEKGLQEEGTELENIPTYIAPNTTISSGKALVLDLGGTNYRAAIVDFDNGTATIHPEDGWKKKLDKMRDDDYSETELYKEMADLISEIDHNQELPIGYCFSYAADSLLNGDAKLLYWTKGVKIQEMIGKPVGQPLMDYLNERNIAKFTSIKVINDTVASLFAGLLNPGYDAYIGLIVGTGTNMATFVPKEVIKKLNPEYQGEGLIPINLESGNFDPPFLTSVDDMVDQDSDSVGRQRFEKAVSGLYLGEIFKTVFPEEFLKKDFNARDLNEMVNHPELYKDEYAQVACNILDRSAKLVAASLAGLVLQLIKYNPSLRKVCLTAEGSLFWSKIKGGIDYSEMVMSEVQNLLKEFGHTNITIDVEEKKNINLIGTAIAALS